jgi:alanyl-tRNA synthetase
MKNLKNSEIRQTFFDYFRGKDHYKVMSSPLIPAKDPTLLFTNAGMNQFKSVFLREETREYNRAVGIQKCMRVSGKHNDFDEVGRTEYHHTFFEMMGNFSFGDYFKEEAIEFAWEILTRHYRFNPEQLWVSVFETDDEAYKIWEDKIGVPPHKIIRLGEKENFWQMGETGPCGPCSEIHFDRGERFGPPSFTENSRRFIEVWNLVFMQYFKDEQGKLHPLPTPSIDTGMGMERLTSLLQGMDSNYQTDLFRPIIECTAEMAGVDADADRYQVDLKVIADHIRALCFLIADGVLPANDGRGYVLRRLLRRAVKHGKSLGFPSVFLHKISASVIDTMKAFYPELDYNRDFISQVLLSEEERFDRTLFQGLRKFEELVEQTADQKEKVIGGEALFKLSDTYGFPLDFARDLARERDMEIDYPGFQAELEKQRERSRLSLAQQQKFRQTVAGIGQYTTKFSGYDHYEDEAVLLAIYVGGQKASSIRQDGKNVGSPEAVLVFDRTPFYAESGGQVGDSGTGQSDSAFFIIHDTQKSGGDVFLHFGEIKRGTLAVGDTVRLAIDKAKRQRTAVHHSATHMLQAALREALGLHVKQAGSYVGPDKLRFDFTHFKALGPDEIDRIEAIVNQKIRENLPIKADTLHYEEAIEQGAIAIFAEKYSDIVRTISLEDFSRELCGGTHLDYSGEVGIFKIIGESSISAGIRRIEALGGEPAYRYIRENLKIFADIQHHFGQKREEIFDFLLKWERQLKEQEKKLKQSGDHLQKPDIDKIIEGSVLIDHIKTVVEYVANLNRKQLSLLADQIRDKTRGISVLLSNSNGKSAIVVSIFKDLTGELDANRIVKEIAQLVNGSGGGRRDFAQAGGDTIRDVGHFKRSTIGIVKKYVK